MKAAFVHDHVFPVFNGAFYESAGFDNTFTQRYINLFGNVKIMARKRQCENPPKAKFKRLENEGLDFYTVVSTKEIFKKRGWEKFEIELKECDCAIIRVPSVLGIIASYMCRKNKIPYIVEVVGCPWDALSIIGAKWILPALGYAILTRGVVKKANYVVYVTERFLEKRYPTYGKNIPCSNVTLENYGTCDIEERLRKVRSLDKNKEIVIGTCASIEAIYKGQDDVIRALPRLRELGYQIRYQLAGGGDESRLKKIVEECNVFGQVDFLGELKHDDVFTWLDSIDIYIHPSKQEGLCRAVIEAMSRGCPIIAADAGGIHEQIDDQYIFKKGNINEMTNMLINMIENDMTEQSQKNYDNAEKYCSNILYDRRGRFFGAFIKENF